jgi:hypothetical protein
MVRKTHAGGHAVPRLWKDVRSSWNGITSRELHAYEEFFGKLPAVERRFSINGTFV